jgi:hypothetical protein
MYYDDYDDRHDDWGYWACFSIIEEIKQRYRKSEDNFWQMLNKFYTLRAIEFKFLPPSVRIWISRLTLKKENKKEGAFLVALKELLKIPLWIESMLNELEVEGDKL